MSLPIFKSEDQSLTLLQTNWSSQINPVIDNAPNKSLVLKNIKLVTGSNNINTTLGRTLQGWKIVRQRSAGTVYDNQDNNPKPNLTLLLISNADIVIDLEVF